MYQTGALLSPSNVKDFSVCALPPSGVLPKFSVEHDPDIGTQLVSDCVPWHGDYGRQMVTGEPAMSRGWPYGDRDDDDNQGKGMYIAEYLDGMCKRGNVPLSSFPNEYEVTVAQDCVKAAKSVLEVVARKYRIKTYARVRTREEIKTARQSKLAVVASVAVQDWNPNPTGIWMCREPVNGYHAQALADWDDVTDRLYEDMFRCPNSWGKEWGKKGYSWITADDILRPGDVWAIDFGLIEQTPILRTLRKGMKGDDVLALQNALLILGLSLGKWGADGSFGAATDAAVKLFQKRNGLKADGIVGPVTRKAMGLTV